MQYILLILVVLRYKYKEAKSINYSYLKCTGFIKIMLCYQELFSKFQVIASQLAITYHVIRIYIISLIVGSMQC